MENMMINRIISKTRKLRLSEKLFITYLVIALLLIISVGSINHRITYDAIYEEMTENSKIYIEDYANQIDVKINELHNDVYLHISANELNNTHVFYELMTNHADDMKVKRRIMDIGSSFFSINSYVYGIHIVDTKGEFYYEQAIHNDWDSTLVREIIEGEGGANNKIFALDEEYFLLVKPLSDINSMESLGHIGIVVKQNFFIDSIPFSIQQSGWKTALLDSNNEMMFYGDSDAKVQTQYILDNNILELEDNSIYNFENKMYMFSTKNSPYNKIKIINIIPPEVLVESSQSLSRAILWVSVGIFGLTILFSLYLSRNMTRNTMKVANVIKEISKGDFKQRIKLKSGDEIGVIAEEINSMAQAIETYIEEAYIAEVQRERSKKEMLQMEYATLCEKMNPHFIYNVLEGINSLAKIKDNKEISEVVCLFAEMLHESLDEDKPIVYLEDEIEYMNKFVALKQILRKGDFQFISEIDEELLGARVPRFIVQPIVENAFKHGIDHNEENGKIRFVTYQKQGVLHLEVYDNGRKKLYARNIELENNVSMWKNTSIGIKSINKRLAYLYGVEYGVQIRYQVEIDGEKWTKVSIELPYRLAMEGEDV